MYLKVACPTRKIQYSSKLRQPGRSESEKQKSRTLSGDSLASSVNFSVRICTYICTTTWKYIYAIVARIFVRIFVYVLVRIHVHSYMHVYWYVFLFVYQTYSARKMYVFTAYTNKCTPGYVQIWSELHADTKIDTCSYNQVYVSGRFYAQTTNRDRSIYCIHSVKHFWAPALGTPSAGPRRRRRGAPAWRARRRAHQMQTKFCKRPIDVPPSNQRVACTLCRWPASITCAGARRRFGANRLAVNCHRQ